MAEIERIVEISLAPIVDKMVSIQGEVRGVKRNIADIEGRLADVEVMVGRLVVPSPFSSSSSPSNTERRRPRSQQYYQISEELQGLVGEGSYPDLIPFEEVEEMKRELLELELQKPELGVSSSVNPILTDLEKQFLGTMADTEGSLYCGDGGTPVWQVWMIDAGDVQQTASLIREEMKEYDRVSRAGFPYKVYRTTVKGLKWIRVANQYIPYMYNARRKELTTALVNRFRYLETEPIAVAKSRTVEEKRAIYKQLRELRDKGLTWKAIEVAMTAKGTPMTYHTVRRWLVELPPP